MGEEQRRCHLLEERAPRFRQIGQDLGVPRRNLLQIVLLRPNEEPDAGTAQQVEEC